MGLESPNVGSSVLKGAERDFKLFSSVLRVTLRTNIRHLYIHTPSVMYI